MGTFDAFTSARLGIYAAQHGLKVTGNNISNINTEGYTRQRLDQVSFKAGAYDRYRSQMDNHVGSGALVMGINQVRDPYLDVRFRNTNADVGYEDRMLAGLQEVADILDETTKGENPSENEKGDGLLHAQLQDLASKLRAFQKEPTKDNNDLVRTSAENLCSLFNKYANKLETLYQDTKKDFEDQVTEINECLTNIRDLNREIRDCEVYGDNALELRDERNRQIDTLSKYIHINVVYGEEDIGCGQKVEKLSIYLDDDNPDNTVLTDVSMLIDGVFGAQLYRKPQRNDQNLPPAGFDPAKPVGPDNMPYLDKDGNPVLELKDAALEDPDNFLLSISKLVDAKNREWKGISSSNEEVPADKLQGPFDGPDGENAAGWKQVKEAVQAIYSFNFNPADGTQWETGDTFKIGGDEFTVDGPNGPTKAVANDKNQMTAFIAEKLKAKYDADPDPKFEVSVDPADPTKILFKATKGGAIPVSQRPKLETASDPESKLTFSERHVEQAGKDAVLEPPAPTTDTAADGTETIVSYQQIDGVWNQVTTIVKHTQEVDLDDNDLYGSLQATRELLTEKGEFTKSDTVANIDENAAKKRGIRYYQMSLDLLAQTFAKEYNQLNQGTLVDQNGEEIGPVTGTIAELQALGVPISQVSDSVGGFGDGYYVRPDGTFMGTADHNNPSCNLDEAQISVNDTVEVAYGKAEQYMDPADQGATTEAKKLAALKNFMKKHGVDDTNKSTAEITLDKPIQAGGLLFSNRNDRDSEGTAGDPNNPLITAANISVAHSWSTGDVQLVSTFVMLFPDGEGGKMEHSTQSDNAGHMLNMIEKDLTYNPQDIDADAVSTKLFTGNFNDMFSNMNTICGQDIRASDIGLNNSYTQLVEIDTSRDGVSGVDLNDEAMNMVQFQKALNASMRLMTVIDEALDRLINNTGVAGR